MTKPRQDGVERVLSRWARYGLPSSASLTVDLSRGQTFVLTATEISQIIRDLDQSIDYDRIVAELMDGFSVSIPQLSPRQLLKLRGYLLLALGSAKSWYADTGRRKMAIARTFARSAGSGYYQELSNAHRNQVIRDVSVLLRGSLVTVEGRKVASTGAADAIDERASGAHADSYVTQDYWGKRVESDGSRPFINSHRRTIRANEDGVSEFRQRMTFAWTGAGQPIHKITSSGDLSVGQVSSFSSDGTPGYVYELIVRFPPLAAGKTRLIAWDVYVEVDDRYLDPGSKMQLFGLGPSGVFEHAVVNVQFDSSRIPPEIWRVDALPRASADIVNLEDVKIDATDGQLLEEWSHLREGRLYGFRWRWRSPNP